MKKYLIMIFMSDRGLIWLEMDFVYRKGFLAHRTVNEL